MQREIQMERETNRHEWEKSEREVTHEKNTTEKIKKCKGWMRRRILDMEKKQSMKSYKWHIVWYTKLVSYKSKHSWWRSIFTFDKLEDKLNTL